MLYWIHSCFIHFPLIPAGIRYLELWNGIEFNGVLQKKITVYKSPDQEETIYKKYFGFWIFFWNDTLFAWPHFYQITMVPDNWPAWNISAQPISHLGGNSHLSLEIFPCSLLDTEKIIKIKDFWDWDWAVSCHHEVRAIHPIREWRPVIAGFLFCGDLA